MTKKKTLPGSEKKTSGGAKLKMAGKRAVLLGLLPEQYQSIQEAAKRECRPVTQFITFHALQAALRQKGN
jgi:uncharacterized protein (DUF1778 family)